ncbi:MAG: MFS transporter [Bacteroidales bacterium]|nr:MFS transporter [Bacteroidales bacterium]MDD3160365.1 MFS transporter [Bacteroidales bacterium]
MIRLSEKIGYGFGDMASSMFWKIFSMYLLFFYTDVYGLNPAAVGTMFLITRIWDSFLDPVIGVIADRTETRWGKFRPYLLFMALPFGLAGVFTFFTPDVGPQWKLVYAYITYTMMMMVYSAINVPYASLLGVMTPDPKERTTLSSYRMFFAYVGSFIAVLLIQPLVEFFSKTGNTVNPQQGWFYGVSVIAVMCVTLFVGCFGLTRERIKPMKKQEKGSLKKDLIDLWHNHPWWILLGASIGTLVFNSLRDGAAIYYFKYYILEENSLQIAPLRVTVTWTSLYLALGQIANMVGVILAAPVSNCIGKKFTFMTAMSLATLLSIFFYWLTPEQVVLIFVFQAMISACAGIIFPLLWSMYADIADYSELKCGRRATGLIFSSSSMSQKLGWTLGGAVTGWLLAYFGFKANMIQSDTAITGIKMMLSFLPAIGTVLSIVFILFYPLGEEKVKKITEELKQRRINSKEA